MGCWRCGFENAQDSNFCIQCGVDLKKRCPTCEINNPHQARFCWRCGSPFKNLESHTCSLYCGPFKHAFKTISKYSLPYFFHWIFRKCRGKSDKTPPSERFIEIYQLVSLFVGVLVWLHATSVSSLGGRILVAVVVLVIAADIFRFAMRWMFIDSGPVASYKRSLFMFGLNLIEIIIYFGAGYMLLGCVTSPTHKKLTALYSSLRTVVTIGPLDSVKHLPCDSRLCSGLVMVQIFITYFLILVIVANVVGSLRRGER